MKLKLIAFGKLRTPGLREAADYYLRNVRPWATLEEIELKPIAVPDKSAATRLQIQEKEAELLLARVSERCRLYLLDEGGKQLKTHAWAALARDWESQGEVALCIGSSLGFHDRVRKRAHAALALGPQTLPHELARVVLLEQVYRAFSVIKGHPYHNEGS